MNFRWSTSIALAVLLSALVLTGVYARKTDEPLDEYLVGSWRQDVGEMRHESALTSKHRFSSIAWIRGTNQRASARGRWETRNESELWTFNEECTPSPCNVEKDSTWVKRIDHNHFKNKYGTVTRIE